MSWQPLRRCDERALPKLFNLKRAARAGLVVPPTVWSLAADIELAAVVRPPQFTGALIARSVSPTEDTDAGTAAGQFESRAVEGSDDASFRGAVRAVVESLPRDAAGRPRGAVMIQPLLRPERGGVLFFDGFSFECTTATGGNRELTSGTARGEVRRGQLVRDDPFSNWLQRVGRAFRDELGGGAALDVEFAQDGERYTLLQARPARFPLRRDPLLSLANHREILGDPPSPWIVAALERAGKKALGYFAEVDPEVGRWGEAYAVRLGGRAWLNFSFFFRLMDHWGLPRTFVTEGVGGGGGGPAEERVDWWRMIRMSPRLLGLQWKNIVTVARAGRDLAAFEEQVERAEGLRGLLDATAFGLGVALRTNFAINGALTGLLRVRETLGIRGRARVTTEAMMEDYDALRRLAPDEQAAALERWLRSYGHRGPLESDPARPRFVELREVLAADLARGGEPPSAEATAAQGGRGLWFALDRRRETFRDELMRRWQRLRARILAAAEEQGLTEQQVFLLTPEDFAPGAPAPDFEARRQEQARLARIDLPTTAHRSEIEARLGASTAGPRKDADSFSGVALGDTDFEGVVYRADDLVELLEAERAAGHALVDVDTVLVVTALEPSWAVVFGRVGAVVTELGGELSHASILLREARKPAIVNCAGVCAALKTGERVRLSSREGRVERYWKRAGVGSSSPS